MQISGFQAPFFPGKFQARKSECLTTQCDAQQQRVSEQREYQCSAQSPGIALKGGGSSQISNPLREVTRRPLKYGWCLRKYRICECVAMAFDWLILAGEPIENLMFINWLAYFLSSCLIQLLEIDNALNQSLGSPWKQKSPWDARASC